MTSSSSFLLASRRCEIAELEQLAQASELVGVIGRFIHALQRERGITNIYLGSQGMQYAQQRVDQAAQCEAVEAEVRGLFDALDTRSPQVRNGSRLFSRVAVVLHGLDGLPLLREHICAQRMTATDATAALGRVIAGLLAVVFEAADSATDPEISRALVALFNYMQGKEFAGQERAFGARVFTAGYVDAAGQQHWRHLIDSQQACFQAFVDFSRADIVQADQTSRDPVVMADIERLRRIGCTVRGGELDTHLSRVWYESCTRRIDAMKTVEDRLAAHLRTLCRRRIAQGRTELQDQRAALDALLQQAQPADPAMPAALGPQLERSILTLVQEQSRRLQAMGDELDSVRTILQERKLVERAKGLLMAHRQMSEDDAYKALRQMAMNQNRRIVDVAQAVLSLAEVLPGAPT